MLNEINYLYNIRLEKIREAYFRIGYLKCPCLNNQHVYFNQIGFRHFLRKGRLIRPIKDQIRRFGLFEFAVHAITSNETQVVEIRQNRGFVSYALELKISKNYKVKIIVIRNDEGHYHFVSIMD